MTTSWKRTETASGAGANALSAAFCVHAWPESRLVRALRWKQDAVCRETAAAAADPGLAEAEDSVPAAGSGSEGSSLTRTIFFTSRIQTQPLTRKETPNTNQKKKGKQTQNTVTIRKKLETLA
jgi:hypothetical protein